MLTTNPGVNDVLCGKGNAVASHEGNIHFRSLIERHVVGYDSTPNSGVKRDLVERVRQGVRDANGRFLVERRDSPIYEEQSEGKVTKKIQQAFRDKIKSLNKSKEAGGLRSSFDFSTTTAPTSNMSRVHQADNAQIPHELSIPGMAYNQGRGLRSSLDSTTTTSSLNTRPTNNTMSRVHQVDNAQIPHELNTSSWMPYDQGNSSDGMYGAEPSLPFGRRSSAMLAMRGSAGSRNLSTETTERSDGMQEHYPRAPCSLSDNAHADMRRGSRNLVLSAGDGRNLEPEGVVEGARRTQYSPLTREELLRLISLLGSSKSMDMSVSEKDTVSAKDTVFEEDTQKEAQYLRLFIELLGTGTTQYPLLTREELLRLISSLGSSMSMDMSVSEENTKEAQYRRLLMKLDDSNSSLHDLTESLKDIAVDVDERISLDDVFFESLKQMIWRSNDSMLGDQSMISIRSQGELSQY